MKTTIPTLALTAALGLFAFAAPAQETTTAAPAATATTATAVQPAPPPSLSPDFQYDARTTQREFESLLRRYPEEVGQVLRLDPSLFRNEAWLAAYPEIRAFVQQHPEVVQNSAYFLGNIERERRFTPDPPHVRAFNQMMEGIMIILVMSLSFFGLIWLIRTLLQHRRWSRAVRIHTELQNKLLDRLTAHDELLRYIESGAGRDLMPKAELAQPTASPVAAPVSRILWSVQAGVVVLFLGIGLAISSLTAHPDIAQSYGVLGTMALATGVGFVVSALVGWTMARKLGLWDNGTAATNSLSSRTLTEER